jgi:hypothetical protein
VLRGILKYDPTDKMWRISGNDIRAGKAFYVETGGKRKLIYFEWLRGELVAFPRDVKITDGMMAEEKNFMDDTDVSVQAPTELKAPI